MATIYVKRIKANLMSIEQVPPLWRSEVEVILKKEGDSAW